MEWQTLLFQSAVIVLLLSLHVYLIERKMINSNEIIETLVDLQRQTQELKQILKGEITETSVELRIKRQTEELKQILKDAERSYESKMKEALHECKGNLTITLESMKAANKTNHEDKDKDNANHSNRIIKEVARGKISKQSTQYKTLISGNANDGNLNTFSHTNGGMSFWEVDLGRDFKIKQIQIFVRKDCCGELIRQLDILVGPSHNKLEKCAFYEGPAQTGFHLVFECPHIISGRYVSIQKGDSTNLALAEVKVMAFDENLDS